MAILIDTIISYNVQDLEILSVNDSSTFTATDSIFSVNGVRLLFSTVNSRLSIESNVEELIAWKEYEVQSGSTTINGVTYVAGDKILMSNDTTPTGTFVINETGRYSQYVSDTLPSSGEAWEYSPSQVGRTATDIYFEDEVYTLDYEQYTTKYESGSTLAAGTYLVVGSEGDSVEIDFAKTIYVGEVYTASGTETFTGTPYMALYSDEGQFSFATKYQSFNVYEAYLSAKAVAVYPNQELDSNLLAVAALYSQSDIAAQCDTGIGLTEIQEGLDMILNYYAENV